METVYPARLRNLSGSPSAHPINSYALPDKLSPSKALKLPSHIPRDLTASLLRPCYDLGRSTVAMDAAGTQRGRSEEPNDAQGRRPSANILNMHKTVAETLHSS